ncbi:MAG: low affinity iron permease family protein [Proteobacteria bacterium]|nr:low affinity iron permease family protein [Pseudomonadota bacterium]
MTRRPITPYPAPTVLSAGFARFAAWIAHASGMPLTFTLAVLLIAVWGITGPIFGYSDTWQLVINTGTTIVTFLMVFLIQNTQNRDGLAIQVKLDELVRALETANNRFVGIEKLPEDELETIREDCIDQAARPREGEPA